MTGQLVEAESGKHVWAERYDRDLADIFAVQDEISEAVTIAIAPAIADAEVNRALRKPPGNRPTPIKSCTPSPCVTNGIPSASSAAFARVSATVSPV